MADIGATLREARLRAKIDINEVEARTKIRAKYLRAIENEEWDLLPGNVYAKSFLRTYGDFLGLDSRQLLDDFKRRYERPADHEQRQLRPLSRDRERRQRSGRPPKQPRGPLIPSWALIGAVLVAVVAVLVVVGLHKSGNSSTTTTSTQAGNGHHRKHHHHHHAAGKTKAASTKVKLQLTPTGPVYVCVVDGTGKQLIAGQIFNVGQTIPTETASKLMVTLGNASVKMKVNGTLVTVPPSASSIGYMLTPTSHTALSQTDQPRCA